MSLQDDAFDLQASLKGDDLERFKRIWEVFCEIDAENEKLAEFRAHFKNMMRLICEPH